MRFFMPAVLVAVVLSGVPALAQTCKDVPRLTGVLRTGFEKIKVDGPKDAAMRQYGSICPEVRKAHGALKGILKAADKDPKQCGGAPEQITKLRELVQFLDLYSECGTPVL